MGTLTQRLRESTRKAMLAFATAFFHSALGRDGDPVAASTQCAIAMDEDRGVQLPGRTLLYSTGLGCVGGTDIHSQHAVGHVAFTLFPHMFALMAPSSACTSDKPRMCGDDCALGQRGSGC